MKIQKKVQDFKSKSKPCPGYFTFQMPQFN